MVSLDILLQFCVSSGLLYTASALTIGNSVHCAIRREISPCTCQNQDLVFRANRVIKVTCERMTSFDQVITAIQGKFEPNVDIQLKISYSSLDDLPQRSFQQLGLTIFNLQLNFDNLSLLPETVFQGLHRVEYFSIADNTLPQVPRSVLKLMPRTRTLDLGRAKIQNLTTTDFHGLHILRSLVLVENNISYLEVKTFPTTVAYLHLGRNQIKNLNGTLRSLIDLEWLLIDTNQLETLEGELPDVKPNTKFKSLFAARNRLTSPPQQLRHYFNLDYIDFEDNRINCLNNSLSKSRRLKAVLLSKNNISMLAENEFSDLEILEVLKLGYNNIRNLNGSLHPLRSLKTLNLTHNKLEEFSLQEIHGLTHLKLVDLSYNNIQHLSGKSKNLVEVETRVTELRLEYNKLTTLSGSLMGLTGLKKLNLSHNAIESISPDDLIGLDDLMMLDISFNHLTTLEETSKTVLPSLEELRASYNWVEALEKDFHGLPRLCWADLSHNRIEAISSQLADNTQCRLHGVNSTLRIYLQGNPVLCDLKMVETIAVMESKNNTKVHGSAACSPPANLTTVAQLP